MSSSQLQTGPLHSLPAELCAEYVAKRPGSSALMDDARRYLPGGETRSVTHYEPFPSFIQSGQGQFLLDVDGHEYLDVVNNYTSLIHGNAFGPVAAAVRPLLEHGAAFASAHRLQLELARRLTERVASAELVRFTNSGSEASALATRIARHVTSRPTVVMAEAGYHGAVPPFSEPNPGVIRVPFNDLSALESAVDDHTAAVFLEPFQGAGGVIPGNPDYLRGAQRAAHAAGALFVLDEVQSLRCAWGGIQAELGLSPDLTLLAKIIGGGFPIGAVAGRAHILESTSPLTPGRLEHSGTFNGHLASAAAGGVTLDHLDGAAITRLNRSAAELADQIESAARDAGLRIAVNRVGSIMNVHPGGEPASAEEATRHGAFRSALHVALLLEGVYTATRGMLNLSTVLRPSDLQDVVNGYRAAFDRLQSYPTLVEGLRVDR